MVDDIAQQSLIEVPVPIKTPRLTLRPPQQGDGQTVFDAKQETLADLKKWMPWAHKPQGVEFDEAMCCTKNVEFLTRQDLMLFAFDGDKFVGSTGLHPKDWDLRAFEIGYWVRSSEMGKGYATEISIALARYAFEALNANRVQIFHDVHNQASEAVIKKAGFPYEGVLRNAILRTDNTPGDKKSYAFTSITEVPAMDISW